MLRDRLRVRPYLLRCRAPDTRVCDVQSDRDVELFLASLRYRYQDRFTCRKPEALDVLLFGGFIEGCNRGEEPDDRWMQSHGRTRKLEKLGLNTERVSRVSCPAWRTLTEMQWSTFKHLYLKRPNEPRYMAQLTGDDRVGHRLAHEVYHRWIKETMRCKCSAINTCISTVLFFW